MSASGIVDTHLHFWDLQRFDYPWLGDEGAEDLKSDYLVEDWRRDARGVDVVATVHVQAEIDHAIDPVAETEWLASFIKNVPEVPVPTVCVGYADLRAPDLGDVLERHLSHGFFRGIRQEAWFDPDSKRADVPKHNLMDDPRWINGLHQLSTRGLSFDLLVWPHQLEQAAAVFRELPELPVVLEHVGLPSGVAREQRDRWRDAMTLFARQVPWAMLKLSALRFVSPDWNVPGLEAVVREAIDIFGPQRCMFGSNFPVDKPAVSYPDLWGTCTQMIDEFTADEQAHMLHDNAVSFYRIRL